MFKSYQPDTVHKPTALYAHAIEVPANARTLYLAGQGGRSPEGVRPPDFDGQADQAWRNVLNILAAADMGPQDIVRVVTYATSAEYRDASGAARRRALGEDMRPVGSFVVVAALAMPDMLVEIEVTAAKAG